MNWTIHKAAIEWGVDDKSLAKWLANLGHEIKRGATFHTREITKAIAGDLKAERIRETRARADALERENRVADGEIISLADNLTWQEKVLLPLRQALDALPGTMGHRCNPTDPKFAERALELWVKEQLPSLRAEVEKASKLK
jgi:phage terminase Nu1 subunit (DNA packaging protein)